MFINLVHTFCYSTELCTERFELPHSLRTSKKKLAHIKNINIWSYNLKFSEKFYTSILLHCAMYRVLERNLR